MRVPVLTSWPVNKPVGTGMSTFFQALLSGLKNHDIETLVWNPDIPFGNYFLHTLKRITRNFTLNRFVKQHAHDILFKLDYDGIFVRRQDQPHVVSPRGIFAEIAPTESGVFKVFLYLQAWLEKINLNRSDLIIVPSQYASSKIRERYGIRKEIMVIPNGIDLNAWDTLAGIDDKSPCENPYILSVAQFYPRKKIPLLIRAFNNIISRHPEIRLLLVGDGFELPRCKSMVKKMNLEDHVIFAGLVRDRQKIVSCYKHCLIFCHSSHQESFGNVLLEAMAAEKPIVAINKCAVPEIISANETGILVPAHDETALSNAIEKLLADRSLCQYLARNAREAVKMFSIQKMQREYVRVFEKMSSVMVDS